MTYPDGRTARQMDRPIVPIEIRKIFEGRVFSLHVETIRLPRGDELRAEIIRHPGSVVIIPITADGRIFLVKQYRPAIGRWAWELPAGSLKPGEHVESAARRECQEEIGLVPGQLQKLGAFFPTPGYCDEEMNFYRAIELRDPASHEAAQPDDDEDIEPQAFSLEEIRRMIDAGEIIDLKTVAGLALINSQIPTSNSQ